ncbi:hypothetical protein Kpol_363p1 [Vanderwaltozyma polyspora DSM 70294]|uniref:IMP-specific 5'-nucleotidase 1 n=1 Tax=Vanderwaltozyma polyspora (strain ATCC 22028 / DSM 70294 / BCRC 21397 / CBS 2163 / NBRC 10782 / NRRL Y-8283 / UCD 57-17) TaxID=436907 RepID=A7TS84_VANPO|nr:uncharacterized protein Kpol_363p1 [Vanderwaltozyma polyspora DSM 70294]EDO14861.1 hypothetical protein Kpol_363p1 [Vanderwaltozyma polyspora DSM 70294]
MSSKYRVEYQLKNHRKDEFITWIKSLLASPFVLHAVSHDDDDNVTTERVRRQYAEIFQDIELLISSKIEFDAKNGLLDVEESNEGQYELIGKSRLNQLVPSIGPFFTMLPLHEAFLWEDSKRAISQRRMVAPSFNDVRHILNTAQVFHFIQQKREGGAGLKLVTFDGDVTLYEDGGSLVDADPVIPYMVKLLESNIRVGICTAAGYDEPTKYESRLHGLLVAVHSSTTLTSEQKSNLAVMGGESNYLFRYYEDGDDFGFKPIDTSIWVLPEMKDWQDHDINATLDFAERTLITLKERLKLPVETVLVRKPRAVGLVPGEKSDLTSGKPVRVLLSREQLEEIVLTIQHSLETFKPARRLHYSCFDGGSDVWCDIGGKDLGVRILQKFFSPNNPIKPSETLHVGDQFAPTGLGNDVKARLAGFNTMDFIS